MRRIDHIVYAVYDLNAAIQDLHNRTGVKPIYGGRHLNKGTHNALLNLGEGCYLEVIAVDPESEDIEGDRWMGIDLLDQPRVTRWCLKSENLQRDQEALKKYNPSSGLRSQGSRMTSNGDHLKWDMILPESEPLVTSAPFMVDWTASSTHPTSNLEDVCQLIDISFFDPSPDELNGLLLNLNSKQIIQIGDNAQILITINSPKGIIKL